MDLLSEVSSETIGIFGVSSTIFLVTKLFTSISPLLTGVLSGLIFFVRPREPKQGPYFSPRVLRLSDLARRSRVAARQREICALHYIS